MSIFGHKRLFNLTSVTTITINIQTDSLPKVRAHRLCPGLHGDANLQESVSGELQETVYTGPSGNIGVRAQINCSWPR